MADFTFSQENPFPDISTDFEGKTSGKVIPVLLKCWILSKLFTLHFDFNFDQ